MDNTHSTAFRMLPAYHLNKPMLLGLLGLCSTATAVPVGITTTGDTSPAAGDIFWTDGGDPVDAFTDVFIGDTVVSGGAVTGSLTVDNTSTLETGEAFIGSGVGTYGAATVSGVGSTWTVNQDPALIEDTEDEDFGEINSDGAIIVGSEGKVELTIQSSAQVTAHNLYIADSTTGDGTVLVDSSAALTVADTIEVGYENTADMTVQGSATVNTHSLIVGVESTADGTLTVTTSGTLNTGIEQPGVTYSDPAKFVIGEFGTGAMNVTNGGRK